MNQALSESKRIPVQSVPDLIIDSAMVNPTGKQARIGGTVLDAELNREWVQLRNMTDRTLLLEGLELQHLVYLNRAEGQLSRVCVLRGQLPPSCFLCIHSGHGGPKIDSQRRTYHIYVNPAQSTYFYQIARLERIAIVRPRGIMLDNVAYQIPVPEGVPLKRVPPVTLQRLEPVQA